MKVRFALVTSMAVAFLFSLVVIAKEVIPIGGERRAVKETQLEYGRYFCEAYQAAWNLDRP